MNIKILGKSLKGVMSASLIRASLTRAGLISGGLVGLISLTACNHPYDPENNPLLTQPISVVVPELMVLEHQVREKDLNNIALPNDDSGTSLIYACSMNKSHFETPDALGEKTCDDIFEKIVKEARDQPGVLNALTVDDLNDSEAGGRLHAALFSMAAYGHLPKEGI